MPPFIAAIVAATILTAPCPVDTTALGCTDQVDTIYIHPGVPARSSVILHEEGHLFDVRALDDGERAQIARQRGWPVWRRENFADAFAACWLTRRQHRAMNRRGFNAVGQADPKTCALIRRAAS